MLKFTPWTSSLTAGRSGFIAGTQLVRRNSVASGMDTSKLLFFQLISCFAFVFADSNLFKYLILMLLWLGVLVFWQMIYIKQVVVLLVLLLNLLYSATYFFQHCFLSTCKIIFGGGEKGWGETSPSHYFQPARLFCCDIYFLLILVWILVGMQGSCSYSSQVTNF